ncbi:putative nucleotide-diphospho-sugar transferase [Helianthus annuus]|uniref:Glycosyltransferase n=1 Tax=Helianthus annuus TaxID=4232 RepID=A0A251SUW1_HELAN|nr:putative nucleotide-diphospho-sugar transferase [Helianthus annuus]KAJ0850085.1 putative nucleotide-diphospho-sugar transferase [Helianthus annuus]
MVIIFAVVALSCLVVYHSSDTSPFSGDYYSFAAGTFLADSDIDLDELKFILKNATMSNNTVIITTLNDAWAEPNSMFDLLLESFHIGNQTKKFLKHLVVVTLDQKAYARCLTLHPHCYNLSTRGTDFSEEAYYMTQDYLKMMWRRIDFLRNVLDLGYNFVFTDADIMWFRDPFPKFYMEADFQIASDYFNGNPLDLKNKPNGGFNYVKSNNKTIQFYKFWYNSRLIYPRLHDQDVFNKIKFSPFIKDVGLRIRFLDTGYFGGFCQPSKDLNKVCTMHANCCVGLENKVHDLGIMLDDWRKYKSSLVNRTSTHEYAGSWTVPQLCRGSFHRRRVTKKKDDRGRKSWLSRTFFSINPHTPFW